MPDHVEGATGPLTGFRVLDISTMIAAPFGAALLADFGADVIKVELPGHGDTLRSVAPMFANRSLYWSVLGRNKCSITLDLRVPRGRELFLELVKRSDSIVENFRPGTLERWDLGYDTLKAANPGIVLVRISGYGQDGPYRDKAGFGTSCRPTARTVAFASGWATARVNRRRSAAIAPPTIATWS